MTVNNTDLEKYINKYYWYTPIDKTNNTGERIKITILVYAEDSKYSYGKIRIAIRPVLGNGKIWVNEENLIEETSPLIFINAVNDLFNLEKEKINV